MSEIELLAPAGTFECFRAAINAGADAVYLGGEKFGARAYAGNFTTEEIIEALRIAHIFGRKIYLTVNTLIKESEIDGLVPYLSPLYEAGLDGVIVQDLGALEILRTNFPKLELHASTQMAITGMYGAEYMKQLGVCRVVPARELSLDEIKSIKEKTGLEIECFIHGAMCYAYSGQCLFSSVLGGRSGNRGRCAGPCRLPYTDRKGNTIYPLSLKDMYTLPIIPELIKAGVYSFKIEGRMKSPEYVAGVTAMYRKYIDMYLENPDKPYRVSDKDEQMLKSLYIRSDICSGYYKKHNDKSMITLKEPGYSGSSLEVIKNIQEKYILKNITMPIMGYVRIYSGEPAMITFSCEKASVTVMGDMVSSALNRPLDEKEISKRVGKLGDTCFELTQLDVDTDNASFMPVKELNELRRMACAELERELCSQALPKKSKGTKKLHTFINREDNGTDKNVLAALVATDEQLKVINEFNEIKRIYINADVFLAGKNADKLLGPDKAYILVMPHIFRKKSYKYLPRYEELLKSGKFSGVMVRNFEELEWLHERGYNGKIYSDYTVYAWNNTALSLYDIQFNQITLPIELNRKELNRIKTDSSLSFVVYGFIPLMYSANCVRNTLEGCINDVSGRKNIYKLTDRYKNVFSIEQNCLHCYNILYNTVPLSLHGQIENIVNKNYNEIRLDFSIENAAQTRAVASYYIGLVEEKANLGEFPYKDFTNGHYKRGVE
jgi:putative protease